MSVLAQQQTSKPLQQIIAKAFEQHTTIKADTKGEVRDTVETALELLDKGSKRVATRAGDGTWHIPQRLKKAVLLSFRLQPNFLQVGSADESTCWDKVPSKFYNWQEQDFEQAVLDAG